MKYFKLAALYLLGSGLLILTVNVLWSVGISEPNTTQNQIDTRWFYGALATFVGGCVVAGIEANELEEEKKKE
jgi:hypothetical protein